MRRLNFFSAIIALFACSGIVSAQNYFDDVYYNPKKDNSSTVKKAKKQSSYIANMADMDVDAYNRRGEQYYMSAVDTIGQYVENGEDFVYTQQIQKFYNPTIVVDNSAALGDVLANAYGNVEIVINNNGLPVFSSWNYPWYSYAWSPWSWGWNIGFYSPWYSWSWGPSWNWGWSWAWGPSWGWGGPGWGPGWGWGGPGWGPPPGGPGHGHGPGPGPFMGTWNPRGNRPVAPAPGWSRPNVPGGNINMAHRNPSPNRVPGQNGINGINPGNPGQGRPAGVVNNNGRWQYNTTGTTGNRQQGTGAISTNRNPNQGSQSNKVSAPRTPQRNTGNSNNTIRNNNNRNNSSFNNQRSTSGSRMTGGGSRSTGGRSVGGGGGRGRGR